MIRVERIENGKREILHEYENELNGTIINLQASKIYENLVERNYDPENIVAVADILKAIAKSD